MIKTDPTQTLNGNKKMRLSKRMSLKFLQKQQAKENERKTGNSAQTMQTLSQLMIENERLSKALNGESIKEANKQKEEVGFDLTALTKRHASGENFIRKNVNLAAKSAQDRQADKRLYFQHRKEQQLHEVQRLVQQAKQQEYLRFLKQNGKAISRQLYQAVSAELLKRREEAAKIQGWIALHRASKYCHFVFNKLMRIKQVYKEREHKYKMVFMIQSAFRRFMALKAVGKHVRASVTKRKTKKQLLELY